MKETSRMNEPDALDPSVYLTYNHTVKLGRVVKTNVGVYTTSSEQRS